MSRNNDSASLDTDFGKAGQRVPNLKIDLQDFSPSHVPLPRLNVDIIFTVSAPE